MPGLAVHLERVAVPGGCPRALSALTLVSCPVPSQVRVYDLTQYEHCPDDVLVLGTDGLWDVTNDEEVASVVMEVLTSYEPNDLCR